jgi:hypothetical protein
VAELIDNIRANTNTSHVCFYGDLGVASLPVSSFLGLSLSVMCVCVCVCVYSNENMIYFNILCLYYDFF